MTVLSSRFLRGDLLIIVAAFIWGIAFYFQKTAMSHIGPLLFIGLRGMIAAFALLPFAVVEMRRQSPAKTSRLPNPLIRIGCIGGMTFYIAAVFQQFGLVTATVTNTGFLTAIYVVVTPFLFWLIKKKSPTAVIWLSASMALAGVWALGGGSIAEMSLGDRLVALSSVFWGLLIIVSGEAARQALPMSYTCIQFFTVGTFGLASALVFEDIILADIQLALSDVLYVGLLSTALTFGMMAVALQVVPAPRASILLSLETLFAAAAGHLLLNERLDPLGWCGAALVLIAVLLIQIPAKRSRNG